MAMRSAMRGFLWREAQRDREDGPEARTRAECLDIAAHAPRELPRDRETQSRAVGHAIAAAAIVQIEQLLGAFGWKAATAIADLEMPVPGAHRGRELHLAAPVLVRVVEQVFENDAQPVLVGHDLNRIDGLDLDVGDARRARAMFQQVSDELRDIH